MIYVKQPINVCSSAEQIEDNSTLVGYPGQSMPKEKVLSTALKLYSARYVMSTSLKPQAREERRLMVHCCNPTCRYVSYHTPVFPFVGVIVERTTSLITRSSNKQGRRAKKLFRKCFQATCCIHFKILYNYPTPLP